MLIKNSEQGQSRTKTIKVKCEVCGKERRVNYRNNFQKPEHVCRSCSTRKRLIGKKYSKEHSEAIRLGKLNSPNFKGWIYQSGYKVIYKPDHPSVPKSKPYIQEHRLIMEEHLGRYLEKHEIIHHIDGNKLNNNLDNLYLCSGINRNQSEVIHNECHNSLERLAMELVKRKLIKFKDGRYIPVPALFSKIFEE